MKSLSLLFYFISSSIIYSQTNFFDNTRLQVFGEVGGFDNEFTTGSKNVKGLSVAVESPLYKNLRLIFRGGLRQKSTFYPDYNPSGQPNQYLTIGEILQSSVSNLHLGFQMAYVGIFKLKNAIKIKAGISYSNIKYLTFSRLTRIYDGIIVYQESNQYHQVNNTIDYNGGIEYERKLTDRLSAGLEFGVAFKEKFTFGSLVIGVSL